MVDSKFCKFCGARIPISSQFCLKCGASLTQSMADNKFCGACGANVPMESQFCLKCGARQPAEKEQVQVVRKVIYDRAAEGVPHWTKPEWIVLAWFLVSFVAAGYCGAINLSKNDPFYVFGVLAAYSSVLSIVVGFFVFVGTEVYLNRRERI